MENMEQKNIICYINSGYDTKIQSTILKFLINNNIICEILLEEEMIQNYTNDILIYIEIYNKNVNILIHLLTKNGFIPIKYYEHDNIDTIDKVLLDAVPNIVKSGTLNMRSKFNI